MGANSDPQMDQLLKNLMTELEDIGHDASELYDTDVREQMHEAIYQGFSQLCEASHKNESRLYL